MPIIVINTNLRQADIPYTALKDITDGAGEILGINPKGLQVVVNGDSLQTFGGTSDPNAVAFVYKAQGVFKPDTTESFAAKLTDLIPGKIGVPRERFYMILQDIPDYSACYMGSTIASLAK